MAMGSPQDPPINMTAALEALGPLVNNPRQTVIQAEAATSVVMVLLLLQLILGTFRRQTSSLFVQGGTWVTYTLSFPAIAYTLGLMQSSPVKNVMYPIWALSLLMAAGCTNAVKVYELADNKQWKGSILNYVQYVLYAVTLFWLLLPTKTDFNFSFNARLAPKGEVFERLKSPLLPVLLLAIVILATSLFGRDYACAVVELGYSHGRRVSKFMNILPANPVVFDPVSMKGYRYPVRFTGTDKAITIDQILECEGKLLHSPGSTKGLKDVCLAYAMYLLLRRRYHGMACTEEHRDKETRDFVLKGLLGGTDAGYERAFGIVEVELGFCHDYFFTKHYFISGLEGSFFLLFLARTSLILVLAYLVWVNTLSVKTLTPIIEVQSRRADNIITVLVLGIMLLIELLQAAFYMASDWCKVSIACRYFSGYWYQGNAFFEKLMGCLSRFTITGHWKNRIDQYSVLSKLTAADKVDQSSMKLVKQAIVRTLISCDDCVPTNGEGHDVFGEFSWALQYRSQAEIMLIWHIATEHLNKSSPGNGTHQKVSVCLSRYCAYLMHSAPELLPGYFGDTSFAMRGVKDDPRSQHRSKDRKKDCMSILMTAGQELGEQLQKNTGRWEVLEDFWTEKILYVAPSDNVNAHMERLAKGGEFLTHIWALLTHAGIHKINREKDKNSTPSKSPEENA